jgi:hypothetical protein
LAHERPIAEPDQEAIDLTALAPKNVVGDSLPLEFVAHDLPETLGDRRKEVKEGAGELPEAPRSP